MAAHILRIDCPDEPRADSQDQRHAFQRRLTMFSTTRSLSISKQSISSCAPRLKARRRPIAVVPNLQEVLPASAVVKLVERDPSESYGDRGRDGAGRCDVEKIVLVKAVKLALEERVFLHGNRTCSNSFVFNLLISIGR